MAFDLSMDHNGLSLKRGGATSFQLSSISLSKKDIFLSDDALVKAFEIFIKYHSQINNLQINSTLTDYICIK